MSSSNPSKPSKPPVMKLKFGAPKPEASTPSPATPSGSGLKLSFKPKSNANTPVSETAPKLPAPAGQASPEQQKKRKNPKKEKAGAGPSAASAAGPAAASKPAKKRAREDDGGGAALSKKSKPTLSLKTSGTHAPPAHGRTHSISLKLKSAAPKTPTVQRIKVKHVGKIPKREYGVGYDSEADDAEPDPVIESQFVLRMAPGPDCDYMQKAIAEKRVGLSPKEGGADIHFRFFDRDGRRSCITIQGHHYAACMVDLPCIIEGMKSWEKKSGWYKTADICQMLLVHTKVDTPEQAKDAALPKEVDDKTWQYPHGLTPPMHYVRKRRFRKRVSTRTIEAVEEEVERLLEADDKASKAGGSASYDLIDPNRQERDEAGSMVGDEDMADAMDAEGYLDAEGEEEVDAEEMERMLAMSMDEDQPITSIEGPTPGSAFDAHAVAQHALNSSAGGGELSAITIASGGGGGNAMVVGSPVAETPGATPGASASAEPETEQDEEDDDEDDDDDDDIDEAAQQAQEMKAQLREEVADLQREVESARQQMERQNNPLLKQRLAAKFRSLQSDLELKKASLGDDDDEE
ncbi:transcription initiation factor tfiid subunit 7 [Diplodia corticola]|uniref:Transcription initiation factor tfiid subunit 7 n=1 Tax=Diplodia corticola TaxID=236234 RepID=A0A1J9QXY4_9PEZI|nr:transcription initiation factor tfiid subunit 7 [Diplodia corticola]OJD32858.1 transcription initiation factor tfiid subunit 7 [Diplodia corticola]